jgi:glycosyltransferase involved in cell wall biosynthesis
MKWLILSEHPWLRGGLQSRTLEFARTLLEGGDHVDFVCFCENPYNELATEFHDKANILPPPNLNTRSIRPSNLLSARQQLLETRPDAIFFCNTPIPNFFPYVAMAQRCRVTHVVVHHGTDVELPNRSVDENKVFGVIPRFGLWRRELIASARLAYRGVTDALFNNQEQLNEWKHAIGYRDNACSLWLPPMDLSRFRACGDTRDKIRTHLGVSGDFVIGGIGRLNRQKSFDVAIRALRELVPQVPNAKLVLVGKGEDEQQLRLLATELSVANKVLFLGERGDVATVLNAFDAFCLPSIETNETLGIVILEAMATRVPVVVTDLPGPMRVVENGRAGLVVPRHDSNELASALTKLCRDIELRQDLIDRAESVVRQCDRRFVVDKLLRHMNVPPRPKLAPSTA